MLFLAFALVTAAIPEADPCQGSDTLSINACAEAEYKEADNRLNRYYKAALKRLRQDGNTKSAAELIASQRSWILYRNFECSGVYDSYDGTIKNVKMIACQQRLTDFRTYMLWSDWLTFEDSTPSVLPRPDVQAEFSDN